MAPSFDCVSNLLCAEDASIVAWDDEVESLSEEENVYNTNNNYNNENNNNNNGHPQLADILDFPVEDDEAILLLVEKECHHMPQEGYLQRFRNRTLDVSIRQDAISWILKVHAYYNFGPLTAYLSINCLDRFLSSYQLPQGKAWMLQLLSVACLSLAAKMEETFVPLLLDLQVGDAKFVFEARTIQRMELLVLSTLKWRLRSITPFSFLDHFVHKAGSNQPPPRALIARSIELILGTSRVIDFLDHRPSAIAAAAVMCASEEVTPLLAFDYKKALSCCVTVDKERIYRSYNVMQELLIDRLWTSKKRSSASLSTPQSPVGVLDAACLSCNSESTIGSFTSSLSVNPSAMIGAKRRKLNASCDDAL
eukprot:Gb_37608 [translate_table: standard]